MTDDLPPTVTRGRPSLPPPDRRPLADTMPDLVRSAEPAVVFSSLAARCVPAFSAACAVTVRDGDARYCVRYPPADPSPTGIDPPAELSTRFCSGSHDPGPPFDGVVTHMWADRCVSSDVDAALAQLMVERAVTVITEERLSATLRYAMDAATNLQIALQTNRDIATAVGILMATHRLTSQSAFDRLRTASQHAHRKLRDLAAEVVVTGRLPPLSRDR